MQKFMKYFLVFICFIAVMFIGVVGIKLSQDLRSTAAPSTNLSFKFNSDLKGNTLKVQDKFNIQVLISTGNNQTIGSQISIKFDPMKLKLNDITSGGFYENASIAGKNMDNSQGIGSISFLVEPGSSVVSGSGILANLSFTAIGDGKTIVNFDEPNTIVVAINENGENVVSSYSSVTLNINKSRGKK